MVTLFAFTAALEMGKKLISAALELRVISEGWKLGSIFH